MFKKINKQIVNNNKKKNHLIHWTYHNRLWNKKNPKYINLLRYFINLFTSESDKLSLWDTLLSTNFGI